MRYAVFKDYCLMNFATLHTMASPLQFFNYLINTYLMIRSIKKPVQNLFTKLCCSNAQQSLEVCKFEDNLLPL